jgi:calcium/calmodulin-dependent protein kinase (CaM kinase) II
MNSSLSQELLSLNQQLLDSIARANWDIYQTLCDPSLTAFEPEAMGHLVEGLDFHHFYFKVGSAKAIHQTTMCSPRVRVMGEVAVVAYVRLNQCLAPDGTAFTTATEETRVWHRVDGNWKHVHFHRSTQLSQGSGSRSNVR